MFVSNTAGGRYKIPKSVRFRANGVSSYLGRLNATATSRHTFTFSAWIKRALVNAFAPFWCEDFSGNGNPYTLFYFETDGTLRFQMSLGTANSSVATTPSVFRDPNAWYHVMCAMNGAGATNADKFKIWVNGEQQTLTFSGSNTWPTTVANFPTITETGASTALAAWLNFQGSPFVDCHLAEVNFIDGQALTPSSFGEFDATTGLWVPKKYAGTYGNNGYYLDFRSGTSLAALATDKSGRGNNWTANGVSLTAGVNYDWMNDSPTNNHSTINGLANVASGAVTISAGNLRAALGTTAQWRTALGSSELRGNYYWECTLSAGGGEHSLGIVSDDTNIAGSHYPGVSAFGYSWNGVNAQKWNNGAGVAYGGTYTTGDVIGVWFNSATRELSFSKNGVSQGVAFTVAADKVYLPAFGGAGSPATWDVNFGQRPFVYSPPTGFKALCSDNLPEPLIKRGDDHFAPLLYVANAAVRSLTGLRFSPDLVWIKNRTSGSLWHNLFDRIRGALVRLSTNSTNAESTQSGTLTSFDSNGFSLGADAIASGVNVSNGDTVVAWNWKGGGAPVANNVGTISSQVSANTQAGFSIVAYTGNGLGGATVGHGLGVPPAAIIVKNRDLAGAGYIWSLYHRDNSPGNRLIFNDTTLLQTDITSWNNTAPNSSVFTVGTASQINGNTNKHIAYCFAEVPGFSKFGKYVGNGSTDGPFINCGFTPELVIVKRNDAAGNWLMLDGTRSKNNVADDYLLVNSMAAEAVQAILDLVSNGFRLRTASDPNVNGATYTYMAFAKVPFKYANAR